MWATTGKIILAVPTFEVNSVKVLTNRRITAIISTGGKSFKGTRASPTLIASPETLLPFEIAKPLPSRNTSLHGIFVWMTFQVIRPSDDLAGRLDAAVEQNFTIVNREELNMELWAKSESSSKSLRLPFTRKDRTCYSSRDLNDPYGLCCRSARRLDSSG